MDHALRLFSRWLIRARTLTRAWSAFSVGTICGPFQKRRRRLIVAVFRDSEFGFGRDQFTSESTSENGMGQPLGQNGCPMNAIFNLLRQTKQALDTTGDLALFSQGRYRDQYVFQQRRIEAGPSNATNSVLRDVVKALI